MSAATFNEWYERLPERAQDAVAAIGSVIIVALAIAAGFGLMVAFLTWAGAFNAA